MGMSIERAELCAMTYDSGGYAFDSPEDMIRRAKAAGCTAIAIADMDTVRAFPAAARAAREVGIKVIYGVQLIMADESDVYCVSDWHRVTLLARDEEGLYDLYRLMSRAIERGAYHFTYVTRAELSECRAHLLIGSGGVNGEVFEALEDARDEASCAGIAEFYDYIELYPPCGADNTLGAAKVARINRWVVGLAEKVNKPVVAVGYAEYADCRDTETANAICYLKNQEMPPIGYDLHLRTTEEMLEAFGSLSPEKASETVVTNSRKLADMISEDICPFPEEKALPYMEYADGQLESAARHAPAEALREKSTVPSFGEIGKGACADARHAFCRYLSHLAAHCTVLSDERTSHSALRFVGGTSVSLLSARHSSAESAPAALSLSRVQAYDFFRRYRQIPV